MKDKMKVSLNMCSSKFKKNLLEHISKLQYLSHGNFVITDNDCDKQLKWLFHELASFEYPFCVAWLSIQV